MNNPFTVLGVDVRFGLDLKRVEHNYRELSRALHPDRHVQSAPNQRRIALERAVEVNEAWRTLRDPIRRAEAVLAVLGQRTPAGEGAMAPDFLMEMMEARERLGEAKAARDLAACEALRAEVRDRREGCVGALGLQLDGPVPDASEASATLAKLRFLTRLDDEIERAIDDLEG